MKQNLLFSDKLYTAFIDDVLISIKQFNSKNEAVDKCNRSISPNITSNKSIEESSESENRKTIECLATNDDLLLMVFSCNTDYEASEVTPKSSQKYDKLNALEIFEELRNTCDIILPLEHIILSSLSRILKARIAFANAFVVELYQNEFGIQKHLQNIRKVLLLESSDLMHQFYDKLFIQVS